MKNTRITLLILLSLALGTTATHAAKTKTTPTATPQTTMSDKRIIVFGDSYSDNGNDYQLTGNKYPNSEAYYQGRFSNGPVWAEYFAKLLGINPDDSSQFINLAYGQAKILSPTSITVHGTPDKKYTIPDLAEEIDTYQQRYNTFKPNDLVVVFIGTNDFFDISPANRHDFFLNAADQEVTQIQRLIQLGAKNIVVFNGRDVTLSPLAKIVARANTKANDATSIDDYLQKLRSLIQLYNHRLSTQLSRTKEVILYDVFAFDNQMAQKRVNGSRKKKVYNFDLMCYINTNGDYQQVAGSICSDAKAYFYYDRIHTTSTINQLLADSVYRNLPSNLRTGKKL